MTLQSLPTAIAKQNEPQAFAARSFARGSWQRDCRMAASNEAAFSLFRMGKAATGHRPYPTSNTPNA